MSDEINEYIAIDIETTGLDFDFDDVTQISAARYIDGVEVDYFDTFVKTDYIPIEITELTGITEDQVRNAPTLEEVMPYFIDYLGNKVLLGHNVKNFDFPFLRAKGYDISSGHTVYDTRYFAATRKHEAVNNQLGTLKVRFGIDAVSHNSLNDARITALIFEELLKLENIKKAINSRVRGSNVPELDDVDTTPFFEGITFVVTGAFNESKYSRKQIEALINQHGGKVSSSLSEKTDYFIQGVQVSTNLTDGEHSSKELKHMELVEQGVDVYKIDGNEFSELITEYRKLGV